MLRFELGSRNRMKSPVMVAITGLTLVFAMLFLAGGTAEAKGKWRTVPLANILRKSTAATNIGNQLFRYAWNEYQESSADIVFRMNRTSCKSIKFRGGYTQDSNDPDTRTSLDVFVEGLSMRRWRIPRNAVGDSPTFKLKPRKAVKIRVLPLFEGGWGDGSNTYLNGTAECWNWNGRA